MDNAPDAIPQRLNRAEPADVFILARSALDALVRAGHVRPGSEVDLVHSGEFRHALLNAQSIACSASASGVYISTELFQHLGIAEQAAPRARRILSERVGSVVARGEAEIGFQQLSELLPIPGIEIVGPLPGPIQRVTTFSAGIATRAEQPEPASGRAGFARNDARGRARPRLAEGAHLLADGGRTPSRAWRHGGG